MTTPIYVSLGKKRYVGGTITETSGADISAATITIALGTSRDTPPAAFGTPDVDETISPSVRLVKLLVDDAVELGDYYCWVNVEDTPEIEPLLVGGRITVS